MKNIFFTLLTGTILLIIGSGILVGDYFVTKNIISFIKNSEKTDGIVINLVRKISDEGNYTYSPEVSYVDMSGKTNSFISNISSSVSTYTIGEKIPVIYSKDDSSKAKINTPFQLWFGTGIMSVLGLIFFLIGLTIPTRHFKRNLFRKKLLLEGTKILAEVTSVESVEFGPNLHHRNRLSNITYRIMSQWLNPRDNKMYIFESDDLTYNPESLILKKEICVYIDPNNPKKYYVDISTLPKIGN